jgi:hydroxylamine reductase (hybrid-cluster protein)
MARHSLQGSYRLTECDNGSCDRHFLVLLRETISATCLIASKGCGVLGKIKASQKMARCVMGDAAADFRKQPRVLRDDYTPISALIWFEPILN